MDEAILPRLTLLVEESQEVGSAHRFRHARHCRVVFTFNE
jgi:hypothetical protein